MSKGTDTSREVRLWLGVATSIATTAAILLTDPYVRTAIKSKANDVKNYVHNKKEERRRTKEAKRKVKKGSHIKVVVSEIVRQEPE